MRAIKKIMRLFFVAGFAMNALCLATVPLTGNNVESVKSVSADSLVSAVDNQPEAELHNNLARAESDVVVESGRDQSSSFIDMSNFRKALKKIARLDAGSSLEKKIEIQDQSQHEVVAEDFIPVGAEIENQEDLVDSDDEEIPKVVNTEFAEIRSEFASGLKKIKAKGDVASIDKKIDDAVKRFDLKLSQTQKRIEQALEKNQKRIDAIDGHVKQVIAQQKQVLNKANDLKKSYVEKKVRLEIAEEVIKQQLSSD